MDNKFSTGASDLAFAVSYFRKSLKLPQKEFKAPSLRRQISRIENGGQQPSVRVIESIAESHNVHPLSLLMLSYLSKFDPKDGFVPDRSACAPLLKRIEQEILDILSKDDPPL